MSLFVQLTPSALKKASLHEKLRALLTRLSPVKLFSSRLVQISSISGGASSPRNLSNRESSSTSIPQPKTSDILILQASRSHAELAIAPLPILSPRGQM